MNRQFGNQAFDQQVEQFFKDAGNVHAVAEQTVTASKDFYDKAACAAKENTKAFAEIAETTWGSTKMLSEKVVQNMTTNMDAVFAAAHAMATAKSLQEIAKVQSEYFQKLAAQTSEQSKQFFELSTHATQHVLEKVQVAATKSINAVR
jgi:phasin family protein